MADFGGWEMPIEYPSDSGGGVLREHLAVRNAVGLFDVSHLGKIEVVGAGAHEFLNGILTNDLDRISDGQAQYTMICDDETGGVIDDLIIYRRSSEDFLLVPNASNNDQVAKSLLDASPTGIEIKNAHQNYGVIALQGPKSAQVLEALGIEVALGYMQFTSTKIAQSEAIICRTGYTGEFGFEILPSWDRTVETWAALDEASSKIDGRPAGLGARDTLRTEMGYPLHGHELSLEITPVQAGASWAVGWKKSKFWGKRILELERSEGPKRLLRGLRTLDRAIPRQKMKVLVAGREVGITTSGTFSPSLRSGIALALLQPDIELGTKVDVEIRGKLSPSEVVKLPFLPSHVR